MSAVKVSGQPEGATHYAIYNGGVNWYKLDGKVWLFSFNGGWHQLDSPAPQRDVIEIFWDPCDVNDERLHLIKNACTDINKAVEPWNKSIDCSSAIRATVEAMIDAGYRKP